MKVDLLTSFKDNCGFGLVANIKNIPSHGMLQNAITALERMMHRGAIAADGKSGDGSGLLLSMPDKFMRKVAKADGVDLPENYAVAMIFTRDDNYLKTFYESCENNDMRILHTRKVPLDKAALGQQALDTLPNIVQVFVAPNSLMGTKRFEALLYLIRKETEHQFDKADDFYIASFSSSVISYKGLVMPTHILEFYIDMQDEDFEITFSLFHQRFSTNTLPQWRLAQPFRHIAHNGEINSVEANRFNVKLKSESIESQVYTKDEIKTILPIIQDEMSDSASVDNFFEFLLANGMDFFKAARALVPAPWQNAPYMDPKLRAYYEYFSTTFEAWDGPAALSFTDGRYIACALDRNGLRPSKYIITKNDTLIVSSEYGVNDVLDEEVVKRGRLQSGEMIGLDLKYGKVLFEDDINNYLKKSNPYMEWLNERMVYLQEYVENNFNTVKDFEEHDFIAHQRYFNVTQEVIDQVIEPMIKDGKEAVGSMGDDTPLAAFSKQQRSLSDFFKQKFAQVTNPPIDPIREKVVMSLNTGFSEIHNILDENPDHALRLKAISPILSKEKLDVLSSFGDEKNARYQSCYKNRTFSTAMKGTLRESLDALSKEVIDAVNNDGVRLVLLDDDALSKDTPVIPMLMAVGRVNQELLKAGNRHLVSIVALTGEVFDSHAAATLIAFGASALYPHLLFATVADKVSSSNKFNKEISEALKSVQQAINAGILKIMSKMGICTVASYRNSGLFDIIGLSTEIAEECFGKEIALLPGLGYEDLEERIRAVHSMAYETLSNKKMFPLNIGGFYKFYNGKEYHDYGPSVIHAIHNMAETGKTAGYNQLKELIGNRGQQFVRDFFEFNSDKEAISVDKVEAKEEIFKRFASAAMSLGSISPEAHECLAEAMNTIGGQSNSGEGGEDEARFGTIKNSKIKQVASGRFGVTPAYLRSAEEIQIKVAQGAKPGEGGQLPGHKVTALIGRLRHTVPGVTLISPPPHHDIYSIEDLAQLIFDLKQVNPKAKVAVKLVSTAGVGTIAAGVAKAYADKIIISGGDGGTGAAPLTSVKFAGNPWEIGLTEAHNALKVNDLRGQVHLQTDGGLKTGLDVVKAAMLGAESYAFGTGMLTMLGCKMLRICHTNRCSVGVATQDERLRSDFYEGTVERIINYFTFLAEDVREILASIGYTSIEEIIGRSDLLKVIDDEFAKKFDFDSILLRLDGTDTCQVEFNEPYDDNAYEKGILEEVRDAIMHPGKDIILNKEIDNLKRSFGALISGEIAQYYGDKGLADNSIRLNLTGVAGQSFGAFLSKGVSLYLDGVANDYVGKGMNGGKIIVKNVHEGSEFSAAGNTCLYGATGGKFYAAGSVGERFAVRNSGALAIVEGTGDHACEYMTGGVVVILGKTGVNFGAGMTGGFSFIYDEEHDFFERMNSELVQANRFDTDNGDEARHFLKKLLTDYVKETGSKKAQKILDNIRVEVRNFWLVTPKEMKKLPLNPDIGD